MILSSFGRRLLAAANGTIAGTIIGLGTAAFKNTGTSGNTVPLLDGVNTWSGVQTFSANPSVTGGAISFPATQVPSAGANDLDDYEEGTWTPGVAFGGGSTGITYGTQSGIYTKIGRFIHVQGRVTLTNKGSSTGIPTITGLPFTAGSTLNAGSMSFFSGFTSLVDGFFLQSNGGTTTINVRTGSATTIVNLAETNLSNTSDMIFSLSYTV